MADPRTVRVAGRARDHGAVGQAFCLSEEDVLTLDAMLDEVDTWTLAGAKAVAAKVGAEANVIKVARLKIQP